MCTHLILLKKKTISQYRYPIYIYITNDVKQKHINLLYFTDGKGTYHYAWIKDFNKLMFDITSNKDAKYFCMKCLLFFTTEEKIKEHNTDFINCNTNNQPAN